MLTPPSSAVAAQLRDVFRDSGYTTEGIVALAGNSDPPIPGTPRWYRLEGEADPGTPFGALVLLFFLGASVRAERIATFAPGFRAALGDAGLLHEADGWIVPQKLLVPVLGFWVASDRFHAPVESPPFGATRADGGPLPAPDPVLGVGPAPIHADRFALRTPVGSVLDLCAGGGILTLSQRRTARTITATDLSARALTFARFNLALNGDEAPIAAPAASGSRAAGSSSGAVAVEFLEGDLFAPVAGRRYDRIVCNPPFILMPGGPVGFTGVGEAARIDAFCERLVRAAPTHLEEGGTFQMIFEWPEHEGEDWRQRVGGWLQGSGCDAWIVHANQQSPLAYVEGRVREMEALGATGALGTRFRAWAAFLRAHRVAMLHGGFLLLRRRTAERHWIRFDDIEGDLVGHASVDLTAALGRFDRLEALGDPGDPLGPLAALRLWPVPGLGAAPAFHEGRRFVRLEAGQGWVRRVTVQPEIHAFLGRFAEGTVVRDAIAGLAADLGRDVAQIGPEVARVVRGLFEKGFLQDTPGAK